MSEESEEACLVNPRSPRCFPSGLMPYTDGESVVSQYGAQMNSVGSSVINSGLVEARDESGRGDGNNRMNRVDRNSGAGAGSSGRGSQSHESESGELIEYNNALLLSQFHADAIKQEIRGVGMSGLNGALINLQMDGLQSFPELNIVNEESGGSKTGQDDVPLVNAHKFPGQILEKEPFPDALSFIGFPWFHYIKVLPFICRSTKDNFLWTGCGKFQILAALIIGLGLAGHAVQVYAVSYILPSAELEFCILVNEKSWLGCITLLGLGCGALLWGGLAGRTGRRKTLLSCLGVSGVFSVVAAFMPTYGLFMMTRFCAAAGIGGALPSGASYLCEISPGYARTRILSLLGTMGVSGAVFAGGIAIVTVPQTGQEVMLESKEHFSAWHRYLLIISLPTLASILGLFWLPESPRWLLDNGREVDALAIYQKIYKSNRARGGYTLTELELPGTKAHKHHIPSSVLAEMAHGIHMFFNSFIQLFRKNYLKTTTLLIASWFMAMFVYHGLTLFIAGHSRAIEQGRYSQQTIRLPRNCDREFDYNIFLEALWRSNLGALIPGVLSVAFIGEAVHRFGRSRMATTCFSFATMLCCALGFMFIDEHVIWTGGTAQGLILAALTAITVLTIETYTTSLRCTALGICVCAGHVGALVSTPIYTTLLPINFAAGLSTLSMIIPNNDTAADTALHTYSGSL